MTWNAGYVTDINYTYGYYNELNPVRIRQALLAAKVQAPQFRNACELGFGQGLSAVIHAAAEADITWWGTDFNPSQASFANAMATAAQIDARFSDQSFAEFCARDDLPQFELIALHGIWTWVSDENRDIIVDFVRRKLAVGGVLYISYNTLPGWAQTAPLRHLMRQHADAMGAKASGIVKQIDDALSFADELVKAQANYTRQNPQVEERVNSMKKHSRNYLAHEYMNRDWRPMYFSEMAEALGEAKVSYVGSVNIAEYHDNINLAPEQAELLTGISDPKFRETVRDYLTNQQFRRDIWVKGPRSISSLEQLEILRSERYIMTTGRAAAPMKVNGLQGEAALHGHIYDPLYDILSDQKAHSFHDLEQSARGKDISLPQLIAAVQIMMAAGGVSPVQLEAAARKAKGSASSLNAALVQLARTSGDISHLASPVTGGGVVVSRFEQLFLRSAFAGKKAPDDWAKDVAGLLAVQGQKLLKDGNAVEDPATTLQELTSQAALFNSERLPILKALGIA